MLAALAAGGAGHAHATDARWSRARPSARATPTTAPRGWRSSKPSTWPPTSYQREHVITLGLLDILKPGLFWTLHDGSRLRPAPGRPRRRRPATSTRMPAPVSRSAASCGESARRNTSKGVDLDLIEDPTLPVLPEPSYELPRISITVLAASDRGDRAHGEGRSAGSAHPRHPRRTPRNTWARRCASSASSAAATSSATCPRRVVASVTTGS